ncbi:MAG: Cytochrome c biogenesis ATP-binding export protein CcmA [Glaciecola sp. HTCC2999]|nr:MAG: Cytochrome c biogenesis ATP-binding export protein CcmA [Glaciecola sp. HTCC2999]
MNSETHLAEELPANQATIDINTLPQNNRVLLSAQGISCQKQDRILFEDISLTVASGELIHLQGTNGAGKTSLIRILVGLSTPDTGSVSLTNSSLDNYPLIYLGHKLGLNRHLSSVENLQFWANMHGVSISTDELYALLARFNLVGLEDVPSGELSAGQQRRVSLARTQLLPANIWILDEPYTSLDTQGVSFIQNLIDEFVEGGGAVLMTSHQSLQSRLPVKNITLEYRL